MTDKSHCKLFTDADAALEFADFYDFRWETEGETVGLSSACVLFKKTVFCCANRSSYPDRKEGEDTGAADEELPDDKTLEYDDETLELTLPSGDRAAVLQLFSTS